MTPRDEDPPDPLLGLDALGLDPLGRDGWGADGVGPLPGFVLPVLELPSTGPDGTVRGVAGGEEPDEEDPGG